MYPNKVQPYEAMTNAEKLATLQKRSDCRAAFTSNMLPLSKAAMLRQRAVPEKAIKLLSDPSEKVKIV